MTPEEVKEVLEAVHHLNGWTLSGVPLSSLLDVAVRVALIALIAYKGLKGTWASLKASGRVLACLKPKPKPMSAAAQATMVALAADPNPRYEEKSDTLIVRGLAIRFSSEFEKVLADPVDPSDRPTSWTGMVLDGSLTAREKSQILTLAKRIRDACIKRDAAIRNATAALAIENARLNSWYREEHSAVEASGDVSPPAQACPTDKHDYPLTPVLKAKKAYEEAKAYGVPRPKLASKPEGGETCGSV